MKNHVYIIAEAGVNHNGDIELAKQMIEVAAKTGVDAIKFQTFKSDKLVTKNATKAEYQRKSTAIQESQFQMLKKLELDEIAHKILINHCKKNNIEFLSSPFDLESIELLHNIGLGIFKIPSGEINNVPYLRKIGHYNKEVILSTGMSDLSDIEFALDLLISSGTERNNISILHCNTEYPTPYGDVNLNAMRTIGDAFKVKVGYSDHTTGIEVPIAAVALGAKIIEKHFTLDKNFEGPDHKASLNAEELRTMVQAIRNIETALGDGIKKLSQSELKNKNIARKSIVAATNIKKGEILCEENITTKRPANGISPKNWDEVIGKLAIRDFEIDDLIIF